ncbi:tyrosine-type recombinase/integrase [Limnohabitans sp.]|uniref:tyrosine-type recombinase/integrase n=1 Tax=Limnohabitans sp. TaxID=1907725 RepID=UPI0038B78FE0
MQMTDISIKALGTPGRYTDDQTKGLHLWVKDTGRKYWNLRYTCSSGRKGIGLGAYPEVTLKQARMRAIELRNQINKGLDPMQIKNAPAAPTLLPASLSFRDFALDYIETMRPKWRNQKHGDQWVATVSNYAFPVIGAMPLAEIDTHHVLDILSPIWVSKTETAVRLRGRIERILSAAITRKLRPAGNPALWKGHLENLLPTPRATDKHHEALPYSDVPAFMARLREVDGISALALEFTILNASRTGEVLLARRTEVQGTVWTIPGHRMKAGRLHQVPLCQRSLDLMQIAQSLDPNSQYLFSRDGKPLSNMAMLMMVRRLQSGLTVHGFRSSFRDWVSEETDHNPEVAEMALAHTIGNKVEQAYRRGNLLERRRCLMQDWQTFCIVGNREDLRLVSAAA